MTAQWMLNAKRMSAVLVLCFSFLVEPVPVLSLPEAAGSAPSEAFRKNPPVSLPPRPFKMPVVDTYKLGNGLTVELVEDHRFPFLTVALGIKAGSAQDSQDKPGIAEMTAGMLTEGTDTRKSKQVADDIDFIGGALKTVTDYDFTIVSGSALSKYADRLFDVFQDVIFHPAFPEDELKLKKANLIEELSMKRSEPDFLVEERFQRVIFGDHPYAVVAPTPQAVERITRPELKSFADRFYLPGDSVLVVIGDFTTPSVKQLIQSYFQNWKPSQMPEAVLPASPRQSGRHIYLVDRPGSVQSDIKVGNIAISRKDPDYFPMMVCNQVLGGAASARLFLNIREQKGFTYGAYSSLTARRDPGVFAADAQVRTEVTAPSIQEFLYELERIRNVKVGDRELKNAKTHLSGSFQLGLETQSGLAQRLLEQKLFDLPNNYMETYTNQVTAVTADQVRTAARRLIDMNNLVISVVGDASKIKSELEYFAPVALYDTSGKQTLRPANLEHRALEPDLDWEMAVQVGCALALITRRRLSW